MHYAELLQSDEAPVDATTALQHTTWKPVTSLPLFIGESPRAHWVRVGIRNTEVRPLHFRMDTGHPSLESVDVWVIRNIQTLPDPILSLRLYDPYSARQVDHPTIAAGFSLEANETVLVLVRVSHHLPRVLDLQLAADIPAMHKDRLEAAISGGFHAIMVVMLLLALASWKLAGTAICITIGLYIVCAQLFVMSWEQHLFRGLFFNHRMFDLQVWSALSSAILAAQLLLGRNLFSIQSQFPRYHRLLMTFIVVNAVYAVLPLFTTPQTLLQLDPLQVLRSLGSFLLHFVTAALALRRGLPGAMPFVLSGAFIVIVLVLSIGEFIERESMLSAVRVLFAAESAAFIVAIFSLALSFRRERDQARVAELEASKREALAADALYSSERANNETRLQATRYAAKLASVNHDIAQPIAALRMKIKQLNTSDSGIVESLDYLERLAADEGNSGTQHGENVDIDMLSERVVKMFEIEAQSSGCKLSYINECDSSGVASNGLALMRILSNLVSNAICHADAKSVVLKVSGDKQNVHICISDDGIGLDASTRQNVLKRHARGSNSKGQGLGLDIVVENCDKQGYDFTFESTPGVGTTACLCLPYTPPTIEDSSGAAEKPVLY